MKYPQELITRVDKIVELCEEFDKNRLKGDYALIELMSPKENKARVLYETGILKWERGHISLQELLDFAVKLRVEKFVEDKFEDVKIDTGYLEEEHAE